MRLRIAIVGAGFSGTVLAVQLLRHAAQRPLHVLLFERTALVARGLAYGTGQTEHLLNVPAGNMSALADEPEHFLHHAQSLDPAVLPQSFLPRQQYGAYLQALLAQTLRDAPSTAVLEAVHGEVTAIHTTAAGGPVHLGLADGRQWRADHAVLALGNHAPALPAALRAVLAPGSSPTQGLQTGGRCMPDPWAPGALDGLVGALADGPALLIGSGLTAVDVALTLLRRQSARRDGTAHTVLCLSRRGLVPAPHRTLRSELDPQAAAALVAALGQGARADLHTLRQAVTRHAAQGGDWRDVIGALRPHTAAWWQAASAADRRRFLRHLQAWWDAARHRCAPPAHAAFEAARQRGQLQVLAGRLRLCEATASGLRVHWTPRGSSVVQTLEVAGIVNCTGPDTDLRRLDGALVQQLLAAGQLLPDALRLGVQADAHGALLDSAGQPGAQLHVIGPWLRARDWEATAVPELRVQALQLAQRLLGSPAPPAP